MASSLGEGWITVLEPSQGKFYYSKDGATQWEWPEASMCVGTRHARVCSFC